MLSFALVIILILPYLSHLHYLNQIFTTTNTKDTYQVVYSLQITSKFPLN